MSSEAPLPVYVSPELYRRLNGALTFFESVLEEPSDLQALTELALTRGLSAMLRDIFSQADIDLLLESIDQMSKENPDFVFRFVADGIRSGGQIQQEHAERPGLGFRPPHERPS